MKYMKRLVVKNVIKQGIKGRLAVHEALYFTKPIREIIVSAGDEVDEEKIRTQARKDGTLNLRENGLEKVKLGLTSIQEVISWNNGRIKIIGKNTL